MTPPEREIDDTDLDGDEDDLDNAIDSRGEPEPEAVVSDDSGSEQPEATPHSSSREVREIVELVQANARVQMLEGKLADLEARLAAKKPEDEEEIEYDPGELPADYADLRGVLTTQGTFLAKEIAKAKSEIRQEIADARDEAKAYAQSEIAANTIRERYKIDEAKEQKVIAFAQEHGFRYETKSQLEKLVKLYIKMNPEEDSAEKPVKSLAPRTRPTSVGSRTERPAAPAKKQSFDKDFMDAFNRRKAEAVKELKAGKVRF